jgi:chromosome segregation ATPase
VKGEKMETDIQDLMAWQKDAERELSREAERLEEKGQRIGGLMKVLEATEEILAENSSLREELERKDGEIDALREELEQKSRETESLREELERKAKEMDELRRQLQEASSQHQESDSRAQTMEIHNHFEAGSNSQVYNEKVTGKFTYPNNNNNNNSNSSNNSSNSNKSKNKKNKKKEQKKWKKRIRKA